MQIPHQHLPAAPGHNFRILGMRQVLRLNVSFSEMLIEAFSWEGAMVAEVAATSGLI